MIKSKNQYGYICDDLDSDVGHYIVDCHDFMNTDDSSICVVDVDISEIEHADES